MVADSKSPWPGRIRAAGCGIAVLLACSAALGWATSYRLLASLRAAYIPMAPGAAIAFMLLASALFLEVRSPSPRRTVALSSVVSLLALLSLVAFFADVSPLPEAFLVPAPERFGRVLTARMSPLSAAGFLLVAPALSCLGLQRRHPWLGNLGGGLASLSLVLSLVVSLGYAYGTPPLYGGAVVPMALTTAVAFGGLSVALIGHAGTNHFPLRSLSGPSGTATLLRAFLPIAPVLLVIDGAFHQFPGLNPALHSVASALLVAVVVTAGVWQVARSVGRAMDRALEEERRADEVTERLAAIVESSTDAIYVQSLEGVVTTWHASAERLFGFTASEIVGRPGSLLLPPNEDGEPFRERVKRGERLYQDAATRVRKDGSPVVVALTESPVRDATGRVAGISSIARDVTEERRAERELRESERKLRALVDSDAVGILFGDIHGQVLDANAALLRMVGYTRDDLQAGRLRWTDITPPEYLHLDEKGVAEARARGACAPYEKQYLRKDGSRVWVLLGYVLLEPERERSVAFVIDISEQKQAEEALIRSEERFSTLFRASPLAIGIAEVTSGLLIDANQSYFEFFGYRRSEMEGRTMHQLSLWVDPAERAAAWERMRAGDQVRNLEAAFLRKGGETRLGLVSLEILRLTALSEPVGVEIITDITERKRLEAQLLHAQKMEAVGRLAGGIAHDFNNLLGVILGYGELLRRSASQQQTDKIEQIMKAADRAAGFTRQLLAFSRKQVLEPRVLALDALLQDLGSMLRTLIGEDVDLTITSSEGLGLVRADPGQIEQVVMNLCVNARDAMADGGRLRIETCDLELPVGHAEHGGVPDPELIPPGRYVQLTVSDTGCGMDRETLSHLFEPFFTTKEKGKGTGLGLSTVYGIVKQSGGHIQASSEPGAGSVFRIYLPCVDAAPRVEEVELPSRLNQGWETILLAEDEPSVRRLTREVLEDGGYRVLEAATGAEAILVSDRHPDPIHLLLTDVVMPGMDGRQLSQRLVLMRPGLRVLYMSGYTDDIIAHRGVLEPGTLLLSKPFTTVTLLRRVREALDQETPNR